MKTKVFAVSALMSPLPDEARNVGMPASCNGFQEFSVNWFDPNSTPATSSWIIWFAQSTLLPGSAPVTQVSRSMGWPPIPLRYWLIHLTDASATSLSMLLSVAVPLPSVMNPILTGVPLAGVLVPSPLSDEAACAGTANAVIAIASVTSTVIRLAERARRVRQICMSSPHCVAPDVCRRRLRPTDGNDVGLRISSRPSGRTPP